ncbi:calcium-responsive transactivator-like [Xenia sp. Carnegie-2017]|uniref:calcium-responsive transactivator-like n=1 Tax=Xenia sp. Carnegie-2017 TaxID=2897299 RepID=UPI001F047ABE|nr:calcium-responsive transactivator-like [Xenia sp. Carnegie-2017]
MSWANNKATVNPQIVQKILDENAQLIQAIVDYQNKGKAAECVQYQQLLHKNLMHLASFVDLGQSIQGILPPVATSSTAMGGPSGIMPGNLMDKKGTIGSPMDQGNSGLPITINSQVAAPISNDDIAFGINSSMTSSMGKSQTTAYPGNVNMMSHNMAIPNSTMIQGQQQNYMSNMHVTHPMQQGAIRGYNRPSVPMPQSQTQISQAYIGNQPTTGQTGLSGMISYQQSNQAFDPYKQIQHMTSAYNPYGTQ